MKKWLWVIFSLLVGSCSITPTRIPEPTLPRFSTPFIASPTKTPSIAPIHTRINSTPVPNLSPTPPSRPTPLHFLSPAPIDPAWVAARACEALINHSSNPLAGRLVRFKTPIKVNTAGIPAAALALRKIVEKTDHAVTFIEVDQDPDIGIIFILGDAVRSDGTPGCGNVTSQREPRTGVRLPASGSGELTGRMFVHLGGINSTGCKYSPNREPYPIAEHEMGHALGLGLHFTNFNGDEGFSDELAAVIKLIYSLPIGTPAASLCK